MIVFPLYLRGWEQIVSYSGDGWHSSDFRLCEQVIAHNITPLYIYLNTCHDLCNQVIFIIQ